MLPVEAKMEYSVVIVILVLEAIVLHVMVGSSVIKYYCLDFAHVHAIQFE